VRVPPERITHMRAHMNRQLILGIRPENIRISKGIVDQQSQIQGKTERIEMLGAETHLYLDLGTSCCVARTPGGNGLDLNENLPVVFEMAHAHFFDEAGGRIDA